MMVFKCPRSDLKLEVSSELAELDNAINPPVKVALEMICKKIWKDPDKAKALRCDTCTGFTRTIWKEVI